MEKSPVCCYFDEIAWEYERTEGYLRKNALALLDQHLKFSKNKSSLLDVCSGRGLVAKISHEKGFADISCVDGSERMLWYCKQNTSDFLPSENIFYHDFENGDFDPENKTWNHILINAGIQYIPKTQSFIKNMHKLLNPNGLFSFSIRERESDEEIQTDENGEYGVYGYYSYGIKYYLHSEDVFRKMLHESFKILEISTYQEEPNSAVIKFLTAQRK